MIDEEIEASYESTVEESVTACEAIYFHTPRRFVRLVSLPLMAIASLIGVSFLLSRPQEGQVIGGFYLAMNVPLLYLMTKAYRRRAYLKKFRKAGPMGPNGQKVTWVVDDRRLRGLSAGVDTSFVWEMVGRVVDIPSGFLIQVGVNYVWIPSHAFRDGDRERFAYLAEHAAPDYVRETR